MKKKDRQLNLLRALILALLFAVVYLLGAFTGRYTVSLTSVLPADFNKYAEVTKLVKQSYVDPVDLDSLIEGSIEGMLGKLDPHSVYIPPREQEEIDERFSGEFSGIGIQFEVRDDAILVVSPIPGTPADRMGLRAGDSIIEIDGKSTIGITNEDVFRRLRGPEGTTVRIKVMREGEREPFELDLTRGRIPIHSVDAAFLLDDGLTGYIFINQFTSVTSEELDQALDSLFSLGMAQLILDLRGNSGGYLNKADEVADRFISAGQVIVSTKGRIKGTTDTRYATGETTIPDIPLVILVSRGSASASEIVAGAVQDNDRGLIIGQPTFGKGLVQSPFELYDGSVVRITTARWYTPSGRCVQRTWGDGLGEYLITALNGERKDIKEEQDSLTTIDDEEEKTEYLTRTGRIVYANEGIRPDVIVDSGKLTRYSTRIIRDRVLIDWARKLAEEIGSPVMTFTEFRDSWNPGDAQLRGFIGYAEKNGIAYDAKAWAEDKEYLLTQIKAEVAQRLYNGRRYLWQVLVTDDPQVDEALLRMGEAESLAKTPTKVDLAKQ